MARLVLTTFAIMKGPYGDPQVRGFEALTPAVFREAEQSPGFIARAREIDDNEHLTNFERDWGAWGPFAVPSFYDGGFDTKTDTRASTISVWETIAAVRNFVNNGLHHKALRQREKWFRKPEWPTYAMWWIADDHTPTWPEAVERLESLHANGPSAFAFTFERPYGPEGAPLAVEAAQG